MKAIIGVFPLVNENKDSLVRNDYVYSIENSGGIGIMLPYTTDNEVIDKFISICDGFLFTGGVDIDPSRYNEKASDMCGPISVYRDEAEFAAFERVMNSDEDKPILAICRGSQLINVALGGTLYQDIPSEINTELIHRQGEPHSEPSHTVTIEKGSPLYSLFGEDSIPVNSLHHQSVKSLGKGLEIMARADDGVVEAIYMPSKKFVWALQWHPERSYKADIRSKMIFDSFVNSCKG